jgi:predicted DNA-binding helix-hairpin-helix protein
MKKDIFQKMQILSDSAKYDVSCSSSGSENNYKTGELGSTASSGICHTFTSDGRCVSLLKRTFPPKTSIKPLYHSASFRKIILIPCVD